MPAPITEDDGFVTIHHSPYVATQGLRSELIRPMPAEPRVDISTAAVLARADHLDHCHHHRADPDAAVLRTLAMQRDAMLDHIWLFIEHGKEVPITGTTDTEVVDWTLTEVQTEILRIRSIMVGSDKPAIRGRTAAETMRGAVCGSVYGLPAGVNENSRIDVAAAAPKPLRDFVTDEVTE